MDSINETQTTTRESFQIESSRLVEQVKEFIHEGNVRRIVVKQEGRTIVEFPLAVGVVGAVLAAPLAALGALAALLSDCTLEVERAVVEDGTAGTSEGEPLTVALVVENQDTSVQASAQVDDQGGEQTIPLQPSVAPTEEFATVALTTDSQSTAPVA